MISFEPVAYDHAARLIGRRPWDVSRDASLLFDAHVTAIDRYALEACVVGIDIYNIEAEAMGCVIAEPDGNGSPTIDQPLCSSAADILNVVLDPEKSGRFPMILDTAVRLRESRPRCAVRVPICGPFTLAGHLHGLNNLLCEVLLEPDVTHRSLMHLAENVLHHVRAAADRGLEVTVFESTASPPLLSPDLFLTNVQPALRYLMDNASRLSGTRPQLIIGGNTLPILDHILSLAPSSIICPVETDQPAFLEKVRGKSRGLKVRINMPPGVFTDSTPERAIAEARRVLDLASMINNASVGTILPFEASPEVVCAVSAFVTQNQQSPPQEN